MILEFIQSHAKDMEMFFEDKERNDLRTRSPGESHYEYLNYSGRKPAANIRAIIEKFLLKYPENEKRKLAIDLKSKEDETFLAAFFELYLYNLMLSLGANIIIHPTLESGEKPDFLVTFPNGVEFYLEAKLIYRSPNISRNEKLLGLLQSEINKKFKGSSIALEIWSLEGQMNTNVSFKKTASELLSWAQQLDKNMLLEDQEKNRGARENTTKHIKFDTWSIKFIARLLPNQRKVEENAIFMRFFDPTWVDNTGIKATISKKAKHYKEIDKPFVIAINNACAWNIDDYDIFEVLLGQEVFTFYQGSSQTNLSRLNDGLWTKPNCQHTRVSAMLFTGGLEPSNCDSKNMVLIHNPWATHKLSDSPLHQLTHWLHAKEKLEKIVGAHPSAILNLPNIERDF